MKNIKEQFARLYMELDLTDDQAAMIKKLQRDVDAALRQPHVSRLLPSDEEITNAANNHQLGGYEWQAEKRKSFELGAKWARMVMSAELSEDNNG